VDARGALVQRLEQVWGRGLELDEQGHGLGLDEQGQGLGLNEQGQGWGLELDEQGRGLELNGLVQEQVDGRQWQKWGEMDQPFEVSRDN
jgi:hypothetical protein